MTTTWDWEITAGDTDPRWRVQLDDNYPGALDLTAVAGTVVTVCFENAVTHETAIAQQDCDIIDGPNAVVEYDFNKATLDTAGDYFAEFTVWWGGIAQGQPETFPSGSYKVVHVKRRVVCA